MRDGCLIRGKASGGMWLWEADEAPRPVVATSGHYKIGRAECFTAADGPLNSRDCGWCGRCRKWRQYFGCDAGDVRLPGFRCRARGISDTPVDLNGMAGGMCGGLRVAEMRGVPAEGEAVHVCTGTSGCTGMVRVRWSPGTKRAKTEILRIPVRAYVYVGVCDTCRKVCGGGRVEVSVRAKSMAETVRSTLGYVWVMRRHRCGRTCLGVWK